jgi:hypothetical protein
MWTMICRFTVESSFDVSSHSQDELFDVVKEATDVGNDGITQSEVDKLYSIISGFQGLNAENRAVFVRNLCELSSRMLDSAASNADGASSGDMDTKNAIKIVLYFLQQLAFKAEQTVATKTSEIIQQDDDMDFSETPAPSQKKTAKSKAGAAKKGGKSAAAAGTFDWSKCRTSVLELLERTISNECLSIWTMGIIPENFVRGLWKYPLSLLESKPQGLSGTSSVDIAARDSCVTLVVNCIKTFGSIKSTGSYSALSAATIDSLTKYEHMCNQVSEIASLANDANMNGKQFVAELMNDIANTNMATVPSVKNIGSFLESFAKATPIGMVSYLPILRCQIDSQAHQIRYA